jgi:hypothetical protein
MRQLRRHQHCLNCGAPVPGNFCSGCGQENTDYHVSLRQLVGDAADELLQLESRLWRSLWDLVRRPGRLTNAYVAGQRVRYTTPLRLYLLAVGVYFALGSLLPPKMLKAEIRFDDQPAHQISPFERKLRERLGVVDGKKQDVNEIGQRMRGAVLSTMPKALALLVPAFALLTLALFRRPQRFFVEHLVFALHLHALAFVLFLPSMLLRSEWLALLLLAAVALWMTAALRAVFAQSWLRTLLKSAVLGLVYGMLLLVGIAGATLAGLWYS